MVSKKDRIVIFLWNFPLIDWNFETLIIFLLMWVSFFVLHPFTLLLISLSQCWMSLTVSCPRVCPSVVCVQYNGMVVMHVGIYLASLPLPFFLSCLLHPNSIFLFNLTTFVLTWITWLWVHFLLSFLLTDACPSSLQGTCFSRWQRSTGRFKCS